MFQLEEEYGRAELIWLGLFDEEMFLRRKGHPFHPASPSPLLALVNLLKDMTQDIPKLEYEIIEHRSMSECASTLFSSIQIVILRVVCKPALLLVVAATSSTSVTFREFEVISETTRLLQVL